MGASRASPAEPFLLTGHRVRSARAWHHRRVQFLVGTSGFAYPQWKGRFYPPELPEDDYLGYYAARLATVEINNTFYRMPKQDVVAK